jgi:hypothetical protein
MATCINCSREVETPYCPQCGQRSPVRGINFANLWADFAARIYGFDGMFPRTLKDLTIRPGQVAREYIAGNRVKYYGPVGYFFLMLTLYLLLASMLEIDLVDFTMKSSPATSQQGAGQREISLMINQWVNGNIRTVSFIIALFTVFFTWLFFRKSGYNLIQSAVLIFFVNGHIIWISIASLFVYKLTDFVLPASVSLLASIAFLVFAYTNLYNYQKKWKVAIKGLLLYIVSYVTMIVIVTFYIVYASFHDKETFDKLRPSNNKPIVEQGTAK